jgi:sugar lactone lactonase YvrE
MRRLVTSIVLAILAVGVGGVAASGVAVAGDRPGGAFPENIPLPNGWRPEGIAIGRGTNFYVGSLADGAVWHGDLATGKGSVLVPGTPGTAKTGMKVDRHNRLWACGAGGGDANVYDAATGRLLAHYTFATAPTFVNDVIVTPRAVYFTDSQRPVLYVVPLGHDGRLPAQSAVRTLALTGPAADAGAFNNGIVATDRGRLVVVQSRAGRLVSVDPRSGASAVVDLGGYSVLNGDGLVLRGRTLYVVRNRDNLVAVIRLDAAASKGTLVRELTSPLLRVPATAALFGPFLYLANARFDVTPTPTTDYNVVRLRT